MIAVSKVSKYVSEFAERTVLKPLIH